VAARRRGAALDAQNRVFSTLLRGKHTAHALFGCVTARFTKPYELCDEQRC
jgi:hypothetical protein